MELDFYKIIEQVAVKSLYDHFTTSKWDLTNIPISDKKYISHSIDVEVNGEKRKDWFVEIN